MGFGLGSLRHSLFTEVFQFFPCRSAQLSTDVFQFKFVTALFFFASRDDIKQQENLGFRQQTAELGLGRKAK